MTNEEPEHPAAANTTASGARQAQERMSLVWLVAIGTVVVTLAGSGLFGWLAWLLSDQPAPLRGESGYWDWLTQVDGTALFDAARTAATILAIVGVGGAALVAYRRQDTAERAHNVAIEGQRIADAQHTLDSDKYQLDRDRHELEQNRHVLDQGRRRDDREKDLRTRFTSIAEQLGSTNFAVRHAGAYALAALADDWHRFGNDDERQVCVHLMCAQLRQPRKTNDLPGGARMRTVSDEPAEDLEVRKTIVALIRSHRPIDASQAEGWMSCTLDLNGADLSWLNFTATNLASVQLAGANLTGTDFSNADLTRAFMADTLLSATKFDEADLTAAKLYRCRSRDSEEQDAWSTRASFAKAIMSGAWLTHARLPQADFDDADLSGAAMHGANLDGASLHGAILRKTRMFNTLFGRASFTHADLRGTDMERAFTAEATFDYAKYNSTTIWRDGVVPAGAKLVVDETSY